MNLTNSFEMLSEIFSFEVLWEEIAGDVDSKESEIKLISEFHDETMDRLKMRKEKKKIYEPRIAVWSDSY